MSAIHIPPPRPRGRRPPPPGRPDRASRPAL